MESTIACILERLEILEKRETELRKRIEELEGAPRRRSVRKPPEGENIQALHRVNAWLGYSTAYRILYGVEPIRNAKTNSMISKLIERLGENGVHVARFYLSSRDMLYTRSKHDLSLLLRDAEKFHTEWKSGRVGSAGESRRGDRDASTLSQLERVEKGEL